MVPEYRDYVQDCRSKLRTMAVRFQAFVEEFNNVWYHGNISSLFSGMAKFSAICCCYGLSRSYARTLLKSIKQVKEQFDRFEVSGSELSRSCLTKLQGANKQTSSCDNSALQCAALMLLCVVFLSFFSFFFFFLFFSFFFFFFSFFCGFC